MNKNNKNIQEIEDNEAEESYFDPNEAEGEFIIDNKNDQIIDSDEEDIEMGGEGEEDDEEYDENKQDGDEMMEEDDEDFVDESIQGFFEHTDAIYCTRSNKYKPEMAITGGGDDMAYLWNITNGSRIHSLKGHTDSISCVGFNFNGTLVATGGMDSVIKIWDVSNGELKITLDGPSESIEWLEWHKDGNFIIAGSSDCCTFMWSTLRSNFVSSFIGHTGSVTCGTFSPDGKSILTGSEDGSLRVWKPKESQIQYIIQGFNFHDSAITHLSVSNDLVLTGGDNNYACLSNYKTGKVISKLKGHKDSISATSFSNSNNLCHTGSVDGVVKVWDIATQQERVSLKHRDTITKIISHPTEPVIYTSSVDKTICVWDERSGKQIKQFLGHQDAILDFDLTSNNKVITASDDKVSLVFSLVAPPLPNDNNNNNTITTTTTTN